MLQNYDENCGTALKYVIYEIKEARYKIIQNDRFS